MFVRIVTSKWVLLFLLFLTSLCHASPQANSNINSQTQALEKQTTTCLSPNFWLKNNCWVIVKEAEEDCLVEPIIMELEDQPVYCPKSKIKKIKNSNTTDYAFKLKNLQSKDIKEEIQGVIAMGSYYLLGYKSGKKIMLPGLSQEQQKNNKQCKIILLDDLDQSIKEKVYLKYKQSLIDYISDFNRYLIKFCKI